MVVCRVRSGAPAYVPFGLVGRESSTNVRSTRPTAKVPMAAAARQELAADDTATAGAAATNAPTIRTAVDATIFPLIPKRLIIAPGGRGFPRGRVQTNRYPRPLRRRSRVAQAEVCKTFYAGSIPAAASLHLVIACLGCRTNDGPGAARARRRDRNDHQRQPRQAQRVRRRDGRAPLRDPRRDPGAC